MMADYENMNLSEVQKLAKQGDKDALYEMAWRIPPEIECDQVDSCAWQDYWFEKAADAGHFVAKGSYACSLLERPIDKEWREKAVKYFEELLIDYNAGRLSDDSEVYGILAQFWLGVMLCEGYHTKRDVSRGVKLLETAHANTNGFEEYGYRFHRIIGELYATGLTQPGEDPSVFDLEKAIKYLEAAIKRFDPKKDDSNNRGFLQLMKDMLEVQKKRVVNAKTLRGDKVVELSDADKKTRRDKMMELSPAAIERINADKAALMKIRQRLAREGW